MLLHDYAKCSCYTVTRLGTGRPRLGKERCARTAHGVPDHDHGCALCARARVCVCVYVPVSVCLCLWMLVVSLALAGLCTKCHGCFICCPATCADQASARSGRTTLPFGSSAIGKPPWGSHTRIAKNVKCPKWRFEIFFLTVQAHDHRLTTVASVPA